MAIEIWTEGKDAAALRREKKSSGKGEEGGVEQGKTLFSALRF